MRSDYGIYDNDHPSDYGFQIVEDIDFTSFYDSTKLNGWYMPANQAADKCIIFVHGRTSNRLKAMKYLALADSLSLNTDYNIFIPDLRNSGRSQSAETYMGYKFAEDLLGAIHTMNELKGQKRMVLYGFSMGGMAIQELIGDPRLNPELKRQNVTIERIILDSPLSNVRETIWINTKEAGLPHFMFDIVWKKFDRAVGGNGNNLRMSYLLKGITIPILILQSHDDHTTPEFILQSELDKLGEKDNLRVVYFSGTEHVRTFQNPEKMAKYIYAVSDFFKDNN
jgi:pimeloyl-ACP methyl ester carboxylesterase